jgi:hypothetical protein
VWNDSSGSEQGLMAASFEYSNEHVNYTNSKEFLSVSQEDCTAAWT